MGRTKPQIRKALKLYCETTFNNFVRKCVEEETALEKKHVSNVMERSGLLKDFEKFGASEDILSLSKTLSEIQKLGVAKNNIAVFRLQEFLYVLDTVVIHNKPLEFIKYYRYGSGTAFYDNPVIEVRERNKKNQKELKAQLDLLFETVVSMKKADEQMAFLIENGIHISFADGIVHDNLVPQIDFDLLRRLAGGK